MSRERAPAQGPPALILALFTNQLILLGGYRVHHKKKFSCAHMLNCCCRHRHTSKVRLKCCAKSNAAPCCTKPAGFGKAENAATVGLDTKQESACNKLPGQQFLVESADDLVPSQRLDMKFLPSSTTEKA